MAALTTMPDVTYSIPSWTAKQDQYQGSSDAGDSTSSENFNVLMIGAGGINFGTNFHTYCYHNRDGFYSDVIILDINATS